MNRQWILISGFTAIVLSFQNCGKFQAAPGFQRNLGSEVRGGSEDNPTPGPGYQISVYRPSSTIVTIDGEVQDVACLTLQPPTTINHDCFGGTPSNTTIVLDVQTDLIFDEEQSLLSVRILEDGVLVGMIPLATLISPEIAILVEEVSVHRVKVHTTPKLLGISLKTNKFSDYENVRFSLSGNGSTASLATSSPVKISYGDWFIVNNINESNPVFGDGALEAVRADLLGTGIYVRSASNAFLACAGISGAGDCDEGDFVDQAFLETRGFVCFDGEDDPSLVDGVACFRTAYFNANVYDPDGAGGVAPTNGLNLPVGVYDFFFRPPPDLLLPDVLVEISLE
jgi:hypothetical protein